MAKDRDLKAQSGFKKKQQGEAKDLRAKFLSDIKESTAKGKPAEAVDGLKFRMPSKPDNSADVAIRLQAPPGESVTLGQQADYDKAATPGELKKKVDPDLSVDKEFQLSLRYRMPKKLAALDNKELKKLSDWIETQIADIERERSEFMERLSMYRATWLDFVSTGMKPAWEEAHDVHIPTIFSKIKAMHSRIYQAILGIDPPFSLKPRDKVNEIQKYEKEQLLNYVIKDYANFGRGWEGIIDRDIWNFVADGTAITKHGWSRDVRKFTGVEEEFEGFKLGKPVYRDKDVEREEIIFDGPMLKAVNLEDFYIAGTYTENPDEADFVGERCFYTKSELVKLSKQGFFFEDAIEKVLKTEPIHQNQMAVSDATNFKNQLDALAGVDKEASGHKVYEIFETYCRYDIDGDGIDEELVVWRERGSRLVLRITYLERACPGSLRPYTIKRFIDRPGSPYGIGMGEMLYGISNEIDYIHNQRLDYGTLQNLPFGFVRAAAGTNTKEIKLAPGTLYPLDDPQSDVHFPRLNGGTAYGFQEEAKVQQYGDELSGISAFNLGSIQGQGPTRTATGTAALVSEVNANLDIHIKRYQRGYKRNLCILDKQIISLLPLGLVIRITGFDGKPVLKRFENRSAIDFSADFELTANSVSSNKAIERETASLLLQLLQNPLPLQSGIVTPANLYQVYRNLLQKYEIRDIDAYITRPENAPESPYTAKDELTAILGGVMPPLYLKDRHEEKLAFFDEFERSEDFSWYGPEQIELYRKTKKGHQDMMASIQAQMNVQSMGGGPIDPLLAAQLASGGQVPGQAPAQQMGDLIPQGMQGTNR